MSVKNPVRLISSHAWINVTLHTFRATVIYTQIVNSNFLHKAYIYCLPHLHVSAILQGATSVFDVYSVDGNLLYVKWIDDHDVTQKRDSVPRQHWT